jgi:hypothetical protein
VVDCPATPAPTLLGYKQRRHQCFKHAPAPGGHDAHAVIRVGSFEDIDAIVAAVEANRFVGLLPASIAGIGITAPCAEVMATRKFALGNADIARNPALADDGIVVATP